VQKIQGCQDFLHVLYSPNLCLCSYMTSSYMTSNKQVRTNFAKSPGLSLDFQPPLFYRSSRLPFFPEKIHHHHHQYFYGFHLLLPRLTETFILTSNTGLVTSHSLSCHLKYFRNSKSSKNHPARNLVADLEFYKSGHSSVGNVRIYTHASSWGMRKKKKIIVLGVFVFSPIMKQKNSFK